MKTTKLVALSVMLAVASYSTADARPRPAGGGSTRSFEANKTFGLGLELGSPTGINGKYFVSPSGALDFGAGYIYHHPFYGNDSDGLHLYGDFLWHPLSFVSAPAFELPFYFGVGGRFWDFRYCDRFRCYDQGYAFGVRVPVGIAFDFNTIPLDVFIQLVPTLDFVHDYYDGRDFQFSVDFSVGARYWFN